MGKPKQVRLQPRAKHLARLAKKPKELWCTDCQAAVTDEECPHWDYESENL